MHVMFRLVAPTAAPVNVRVNAVSSSSISVVWSKPNKSVLHGILRGYEIKYRRIECSEPDPVSVPNNTRWILVKVEDTSSSKAIDGLVFWSCYELQMRAVTVGNGPLSAIQQIRTLEHGRL